MATKPTRDERSTGKNGQKRSAAAPKKLSRLSKPEGMSLEDWQRQLRQQYGREQDFLLKNVGDQPVFSHFRVTNPLSKNSYRVEIRGCEPGDNFCSCPDFATNTLGTCKHIEFTLARLEKKRGAKKALTEGFQPSYSEVLLHYGAQREVRFHPGTECPLELARLAEDYFGAEGTLLPEAVAQFDTFLTKAADIDHELRCQENVLSYVAEVRDAAQRSAVVDKVFPKGIDSPAFQTLLRVPLYEYQRQGALFASRAGRCLIGDEMGLGKTIQAIAAAEIMAKNFGVERALIVCPTSLKHQWEREISKFAERSATVIGGPRGMRHEQFSADSFFKIMNYETVHVDLDLIEAWAPDLVILDEAQRIKNWETRTARSVKRISSPYAIVLTGTPLENRLQELVSIVQFVDLHRLGPTFRLLHDHQMLDENGKVIGYRDLDRLGKTLEPLLLRRRKSEVLSQLPERLDSNFFVQMTPLQQQMHAENQETVARIVAKWKRYRFLSEADQRRLMICMQNMRMSCDSSYLLDQETDSGVKADEAAMLLDEILEEPGAKVVIFSQWVRMHELLVRRFEGRKWDHVFFHGGVESRKRKELIDRFREDPNCRVFLSTDAGGVGLNLQHANVVINMDLPWNPAVLEQRIGRVHRLGQTQPVQVFNFVAKGTIEEGMLALLGFKKSLFTGVLDGGDREVFLGGTRLNRFMETVEKATDGIPQAAPAEEPQPSLDVQSSSRRARSLEVDEEPAPTTAVAVNGSPAQSDPFAGLLQSGLALLQQFAGASNGKAANGKQAPERRPLEVIRDPATGESYVKLRMPEPEVVEQALKAFGSLLESLTKQA